MKNLFDKIFPNEKIILKNGKIVFKTRKSKTPIISFICDCFYLHISAKVTNNFNLSFKFQ